jgi:hypothetical protein
MHSVTISGEQGAVLWGYREAATLRAWTLSRTDAGALTLSGTITMVDHQRISQRPLIFLVRRPDGIWRWPILTLQTAGEALTASLGPRE